jgi:putative transposase
VALTLINEALAVKTGAAPDRVPGEEDRPRGARSYSALSPDRFPGNVTTLLLPRLGIEVAHSIPSLRVIRVMEQLIELHGKPRALRLDNGPELTAIAFTGRWLGKHPGGSSDGARTCRTPVR